MCGNVTATAATAALGGRFEDLGTKYDGIDDLHNGDRCVGGSTAELGSAAEIVIGRAFENADIALTTKENNLLFQYRDALKFLNTSRTDTSLKAELDIEFDVDGVETAVEGNGGDVDLCPSNAGTFDTDIGRVCHDVIPKIG